MSIDTEHFLEIIDQIVQEQTKGDSMNFSDNQLNEMNYKLYSLNLQKAKSQKIIGIKLIKNSLLANKYYFNSGDKPAVILDDSDLALFKKYWLNYFASYYSKTGVNLEAKLFGSYSWFARPCPLTPRHGFVDSRKFKSFAELEEIWKETRKADEQGELLITNWIEAKYNAVLTPSVLSVGPGHDGATNGNDAISLSVQGEVLTESEKELAQIKNTEYVELVYSLEGQAILTQFRDGPELARTVDYIPRDFTVKDVVFVQGQDLLEWEKLIDGLQDKQNTAVYHKGGVLGSHYAVHCRLSEVAYITSFEPFVGQELKALKEDNSVNYQLVKSGLSYGLSKAVDQEFSMGHSDHYNAIGLESMALILYTLHNFNLIGQRESFFLGYAIACMIRLCTAASLGELRHFSGIINTSKESKKSRTQVYREYLSNVREGIGKLKIAKTVFLEGNWPGGGYGGKTWGNCTEATIDLINAAIQFERKQNKQWFNNLIGKYNIVINQVHNGGKFLNKFMDNTSFDLAANNPALFAGRYGSQLYKVVSALEKADKGFREPSNFRLVRKRLGKLERKQIKKLFDNQEGYPRNDDDDDDIDACTCPSCNPR